MSRSTAFIAPHWFRKTAVARRSLRFAGGLFLFLLFGLAAVGQGPGLTFASTPVGTASQPVAVTLVMRASGRAASPLALSGGITGLDFAVSGPGTCAAGLPVSIGQTCTLNVIFTPLYPGVRQGAAQLLSSDGQTVLASTPLSGIGQGGLPVLVPGTINTVAGDGQWIYHGDGVLATSAPVFLPNGLAVDGAANLFFSDSSNNRVRRVDAKTGLISTVAGNGNAGYSGDNGLATQAEVNSPTGLVLDGAGNLYIADSANNLIRRVDAVTGAITTVAGTPGTTGYTGDGGLAANATLTGPQGLALTPSGDLLIADSGNAAVRLLTFASKRISTVAGTGTQGYNGDGISATTAQLNEPWGVATRSDGAVAIADLNNHRVRLVSTAGVISTVAGTGVRGFSGDSSTAATAQLNSPAAIAFDPAGDLLIADAGNNRVRGIYGSPGIITTLTGTASEEFAGDAGPADQASLYGPYALLFDPMGNIWISDMFHNRVRKISGSSLGIAYSAMRVSKRSAPVLETLYNAGNGNLTLAAPVLKEAALDPNITTCNTAAMSPTLFCNMGVEFAPTEVGKSISGSVQWPSDAPNVTPVDSLTGQVLSVEPTSVALVANANPGLLGKPLTLTATVTSADTSRSGTVTFVEGSSTWCNAVPLAADGTAACTIPSLSLGTHTFTANYSGDDNNAASNSAPYNETIKQQAALAFAVSPVQSVVTGTVTLNLSAADQTGTPTGTIVFYDGTTALASVTLDSNGAATWHTSSLAIGTHLLSAQYSGDATNVSGTSNTVAQQVTQANTSTTLASSNGSPTVGSSITFNAAVSSTNGPAPTGTVQFTDGTGPNAAALGSVPLTNTGTASFSTAGLTPGTHNITAIYSGDADNATSTSAPMVETVQQIATVTTVATDVNPLNAKATLHLSATVALAPGAISDGSLSGSISFFDGGTQLGTVAINAAGSATLAVSTLSVGIHPITAAFTGSTNYAVSTSPVVNQTVQLTASQTSLSSSSTTSLAGKSITLQTIVTGATGTPTGSVSFHDGSTQLGIASLDAKGNASLTLASLTAGTHNLTVSYSGDANFAPSTSAALQQTVQLANPVLTLSTPANSVQVGTAVQFPVTLTSPGITPTGTLSLQEGNTTLVTLHLSATSSYTFSTNTLSLGTHTLTSTYSGDADNANAVSSAVTLVVGQAPTTTALTSSVNPLTQSSALALNVVVSSDSPNLGGTVTFFDGANRLGTATLAGNGTASLNLTTSLSLGQHLLTATYNGDVNHTTSTSTALPELVVQAIASALSSSSNPSPSGGNIVFTASFAGNGVSASGTAIFRDGGTLLATVPLTPTGTATYATPALAVGTHLITVTYSGDSNYAVTTAQLTQTVVSDTTQVILSASSSSSVYGQSLTFTASVTSDGGAATGTVAFLDGGVNLGSAQLNANQVATFTTDKLSPGNHAITAHYLGNGSANASVTTPLAVSVKQTTSLAVVSSSNPSPTLNAITFTATLTDAGVATATGPINFFDGVTNIGSAALDASGHASLSVPQLAAGNHVITAAYNGDVADLPSNSAPLTELIQLRQTAATVTGSATDPANPQQVTLIAVVKGEGSVPPSGTVSFTAGTLTLGVATVDKTGVATITVIFETTAQQVQASYTGDASYAASQSTVTPITAGQAAQFTLNLSSQSMTLVTKQHATVDLNLASVKGFTDNIVLGCEGLPYAATCTFSKSQLILNANGSVSATLVIDTGNPLGAGSATTASLNHPRATTLLCFTPASLLLLLFGRRTRTANRGKLSALLLLAFTLTLAMGATGCSGLSVSGTPPGTYSFKVVGTGEGSGTTQAQTVTLVVTQ